MPYRRTGRPPGRPGKHPLTASIAELERKAANAQKAARYYQRLADERIAAELASGKTRRQVGAAIGKTIGHVDYAVQRHSKRTESQA